MDSNHSRQIQCPHCKKQTVYAPENPYRPFCSERCRMIDLGAWADESYKVPLEQHTPDVDISADADEEDSDGEEHLH